MHLKIRRLSKSYGFAWALRNVDLEFDAGDCVALLGPNGAGKTTLLKTLAGLIRPSAGEVLIDDVPPGRRPHSGAIGLLVPGDHLYDKLTVEENLRLFLALYGKEEMRGALGDALAQVGLADWAGEYVAALSSGMKCRLSIAKWRLLLPRLLLVDEPYGVLDGGGVDLLEAHLRQVCRGGGIVLLATHDVARAAALCSRAVVLKHGRVSFDEAKRGAWETFDAAVADFLPRA